MEPVMARKMWRTLEPYHGLIYFAPEATAAYEALGVMGFDGYFASRAAPMGAVPAEVVVATFFNFNPAIVHHAIPAAWEATTPEALLEARVNAVVERFSTMAQGTMDRFDRKRERDGCEGPGDQPVYRPWIELLRWQRYDLRQLHRHRRQRHHRSR